MMTRARFIMLNLYHILVDGLFDTVPVILSFMALAYGSGETEVGLIVSLGTALSTTAGLGTSWFSRRFGFAGSVALLTGLAGLGMLGAGIVSTSGGWTAPGAAGGMPVAGACMLAGSFQQRFLEGICVFTESLGTADCWISIH